MASIGGVSCDFVRGSSTTLKERLDVYPVPGVDGLGAQKLGRSDSSFRFEAMRLSTHGTVAAWFASIEALQGTVVSVTDDWGKTHTGLLIVEVSEGVRTPNQAPGALGAIGRISVSGMVLA